MYSMMTIVKNTVLYIWYKESRYLKLLSQEKNITMCGNGF